MTIYRNYGSSIKHSFSTPGEAPLPVDTRPPVGDNARPVVCLPLMTKPAKSPFEGIKYLPEMWKPNA